MAMDPVTFGTIGVLALVLLIFVGVPLAFAIGAVGLVGISVLVGPAQAALQMWQVTFQSTTDFLMTSHAAIHPDGPACIRRWSRAGRL